MPIIKLLPKFYVVLRKSLKIDISDEPTKNSDSYSYVVSAGVCYIIGATATAVGSTAAGAAISSTVATTGAAAALGTAIAGTAAVIGAVVTSLGKLFRI